MSISLIVGLANPGSEYSSTRHNAGAWWLEAICNAYQINLLAQNKLQANIATANIGNNQVKLAIPTTYMNHSGQSVQKIAKYFNILAKNILVVHDELDFPPGIIRIKSGGGHGGHNGLRDIISQLGTDNFQRIRIGIGRPKDKDQVADYVLANPSASDQKLITQAIENSLDILPAIISGDLSKAMNILHQT